MNQQEYIHSLSVTGHRVHARLEEILSPTSKNNSAIPKQLLHAMRHGLLNGGKRLRPFLVIESAALFGVSETDSMQTACALECLHSYSLIHDDLPAMDDDHMRRGQPTVHIAFDEATAILAGDALLTLAFELVTDEQAGATGNIRAELANLLAKASGASGMIGGQILDLKAEAESPSESEITTLQAMKTGALIRYAVEAGAILGNANKEERADIIRYGEIIGLAFQLADDLLDVTSDSTTMGKAVGKDAYQGKGTLVAIHGATKVEAMLSKLVDQAMECLEPFGNKADTLRQTAIFITQRKN